MARYKITAKRPVKSEPLLGAQAERLWLHMEPSTEGDAPVETARLLAQYLKTPQRTAAVAAVRRPQQLEESHRAAQAASIRVTYLGHALPF